jgi:branched-chain amino acid transport system permease protein
VNVTVRQLATGAAALALLYGIPFLVGFDGFLIHIAVLIAINSINALGLGLIFGYAGQLSLAHAAFYGIGAYAGAMLALHWSASFWLCLPLAALAAMIVAAVLAPVLVRMEGIVFALGTYAVGEMVRLVFVNWWQVTGGPQGLAFPHNPEGFGPIAFTSRGAFYYIAATILALVYVALLWLMRTRMGSWFLAVREEPILARSLGIDVTLAKGAALVISAGIAGLTGVLYLYYFRHISPEAFTVWESILLVLIAMIGGLGTMLGPIVGAAIFLTLPEILRISPAVQPVLIGVILIIVVVVLPRGIVGSCREMWLRRRQRHASPPGA